MNAPKNIIIINDERAGQNTAFRDMNDFSRTMLAGGWTDNDIQEFVDDEHAGIGRLTVLDLAEMTTYGGRRQGLWHCRCDCGEELDLPTDKLPVTGKSRS